MTGEYKFGNIIRPRSRFIDQQGTVWSCHEKNGHSVTLYRCSEDGGEIETVPSAASAYVGMTDAYVMEVNGFTPLLIPDNMLICHCQFDGVEQCPDCDELGLIHATSYIGGLLDPQWMHLTSEYVTTTAQSLQTALINTIAIDLYYAAVDAGADPKVPSVFGYLQRAQIIWERMTTKIELGYGFDGLMTGKEWHSMSGDPLPGDPLYDEWVAFNTPDENDLDPYDDCPGIAVMAQYI